MFARRRKREEENLGLSSPAMLTLEELTKAAALHDKGVLTDAEFEVLKKKLLAG